MGDLRVGRKLQTIPSPITGDGIEEYPVGTPVDNPGDDEGAPGRRHLEWTGIAGLSPPPSWRADPRG
jgi:hypothetical protein